MDVRFEDIATDLLERRIWPVTGTCSRTNQDLIRFTPLWIRQCKWDYFLAALAAIRARKFFLLNFFFAEGGCEFFGSKTWRISDVGLAFVGAALDPLDRLFERLYLPEPEGGDEFLGFGEGAVNDGALLAGEVDAGAFGRGMKTVVAY